MMMRHQQKRITVEQRARKLAEILGINYDRLKERSDCDFPQIPIDRRRLKIAARAVHEMKS